MAVICPTVTAYDLHEYREEMERLEPFAPRIHIDLMDGHLAPTVSPGLAKIWWPKAVTADIHLMYAHPMTQLDRLIALKPSLVIIHYEAQVEHEAFAARLRAAGIRSGLALLPATTVEKAAAVLAAFDHALIFSGNLGYHGGQADLALLDKVRALRDRYAEIEISWDGGVNASNAPALVEAGVDVLNVGGFIHKAADPQQHYELLQAVTAKA